MSLLIGVRLGNRHNARKQERIWEEHHLNGSTLGFLKHQIMKTTLHTTSDEFSEQETHEQNIGHRHMWEILGIQILNQSGWGWSKSAERNTPPIIYW